MYVCLNGFRANAVVINRSPFKICIHIDIATINRWPVVKTHSIESIKKFNRGQTGDDKMETTGKRGQKKKDWYWQQDT